MSFGGTVERNITSAQGVRKRQRVENLVVTAFNHAIEGRPPFPEERDFLLAWADTINQRIHVFERDGTVRDISVSLWEEHARTYLRYTTGLSYSERNHIKLLSGAVTDIIRMIA